MLKKLFIEYYINKTITNMFSGDKRMYIYVAFAGNVFLLNWPFQTQCTPTSIPPNVCADDELLLAAAGFYCTLHCCITDNVIYVLWLIRRAVSVIQEIFKCIIWKDFHQYIFCFSIKNWIILLKIILPEFYWKMFQQFPSCFLKNFVLLRWS